MIEFFRKIRQNLVAENKFSKYLIYAVGEIILVVIGILIALSINNWNEKRKDNNLMTTYASRLIDDLGQDISTIKQNKTRTEKMQSLISEFTKSLDSEMPIQDKISVTEEYFTEGWSTISFASQKNTYTDLSQTGNMKVFKDTDLREQILSYYSLVDKYANSYIINKDWVLPIDVSISEETNALEFSSQTKDLYNLSDKSSAILELNSHKKLLKRHASVHFWINNSAISHLTNLKKTAEELILALQ